MEQEDCKEKLEYGTHVYRDLGFDITIRNVSFKQIYGIDYWDLNLKRLQEVVALKLVEAPRFMTGAQFKFLRLWLGLNQEQIGIMIGYGAEKLYREEKLGDQIMNLRVSSYFMLRMLVYDKLPNITEKMFKQRFRAKFATELDTPLKLTLDGKRLRYLEKNKK